MSSTYSRLALGLLCLVGLSNVSAVEGGYLSTHPDWQGKTHATPDAATRAKEKEARQADIQAQIAFLKERLKRVPSDAKMKELQTKLEQVHKDYGWVAEQGLVYGRRCIDPMLKDQHTLPENLLKAFIQLNNDFKARDIDLIILPLVPTPHFAAHGLVDGIEANHEYYPGWTKMMIQMLENDLEIVDSVDEFRAEAENNLLVSWANDFHTGSLGRQLAAKKLAERLQRYDFARDLKGNVGKWTATEKTKVGASMPQRILVVNRAMMSNVEYWQRQDKTLKRWQAKKKPLPKDKGLIIFKGKGESTIRPDVPSDCVPALKKLSFKYLNLKGPEDKSLLRTDMVMIGDSQLHSAVYGSGLPEFINSEVGGSFRWGSKSWSGFSPPDIYREVVPDNAVKPRVVVLAFLPKYFWHAYSRDGKTINEAGNKYKPRPLPPVGGATASAGPAIPKGSFDATVEVIKVAKKPTEDASTLDYDEALMHIAVKVLDGPLKGKEVGIRYWILNKGSWTKADKQVKPKQTLKLKLQNWHDVIKKDGKLRQHQTFGDDLQPVGTPILWVTDGPLSPAQVL